MTDDAKIESVATLMYSELEGTHPLDWITLELGDQKKYLDLAKKVLELLSTAVTSLPEQRDVGRYEDMSPNGHLRVGLDADNDVYVSVFDDKNKTSSSVEFCTVGNGGGKSPKTRTALIELMKAIKADNKDNPNFDFWNRKKDLPF